MSLHVHSLFETVIAGTIMEVELGGYSFGIMIYSLVEF